MKSQWIGLALIGLAACAGCGHGAAGPNPEAREALARVEEPGGRTAVRASADLQKKWGIDVSQATRATVTGAITVPGVMNLDLQHTARISSLLEGQAVSIDAQVGDQVRKNQVLVTVHAPAMAQARKPSTRRNTCADAPILRARRPTSQSLSPTCIHTVWATPRLTSCSWPHSM